LNITSLPVAGYKKRRFIPEAPFLFKNVTRKKDEKRFISLSLRAHFLLFPVIVVEVNHTGNTGQEQ